MLRVNGGQYMLSHLGRVIEKSIIIRSAPPPKRRFHRSGQEQCHTNRQMLLVRLQRQAARQPRLGVLGRYIHGFIPAGFDAAG